MYPKDGLWDAWVISAEVDLSGVFQDQGWVILIALQPSSLHN